MKYSRMKKVHVSQLYFQKCIYNFKEHCCIHTDLGLCCLSLAMIYNYPFEKF